MKRTDVRYQAPRRTFVNEAIISESLIGHPVLRIFTRIKISRIEITNWKSFTKRRARVKSLPSRCRFSCHIFPHRSTVSLFTSLSCTDSRSSQENQEKRETEREFQVSIETMRAPFPTLEYPEECSRGRKKRNGAATLEPHFISTLFRPCTLFAAAGSGSVSMRHCPPGSDG